MHYGVRALVGIGVFSISCAKAPPDGAPASSPAPQPMAEAPSAPTAMPAPSHDPPPEPPKASPFECQIRAAKEIKLGQAITVHFKLTSHAPSPLYVLNWRTPLEGLRGDDFLVVRNGTEIHYNGPMFKRADPPARNYLAVEPGKALEADVDLALAYDFTKVGTYRVTFTGHLWDVVSQKSDVPRPMDRHVAAPLMCAPVEIEVVAP